MAVPFIGGALLLACAPMAITKATRNINGSHATNINATDLVAKLEAHARAALLATHRLDARSIGLSVMSPDAPCGGLLAHAALGAAPYPEDGWSGGGRRTVPYVRHGQYP